MKLPLLRRKNVLEEYIVSKFYSIQHNKCKMKRKGISKKYNLESSLFDLPSCIEDTLFPITNTKE